MRETEADLETLDRLLDTSLAGSNAHLRSIIRPGRTLDARQLVTTLAGMKVLVLATTTASGEPRTSAVDGHFLRGCWVFSTDGMAYKARHLRRRPAASATYLDGERLGVFAHGEVEELTSDHPDFGWVDAYLTEHYGESPASWGDDMPYFRLRPHWLVVFAAHPEEFPEGG